MQLNHSFKVSTLAVAIALVGCGGDINITPTVNDNSSMTDNSVTNSNNTTTTPVTEVEVNCASYQSDAGVVEGVQAGNDCIYNDSFSSKTISIESNITFEALPEGGVHLLDSALQIGKDGDTTTGFVVPMNGPTMTVKPGATLAFKSGEAIIRIARGAKLQAIGTFEQPITFTSSNAFSRYDDVGNGPRYADWGGIVINGNGITDQCSDEARAAATCNVPSEGIVSYFGGNNNDDSSGSIKYAKIWYAGSGPRAGGEGDDLNSLTLNAVGAGSSFEFIHIHQGYDDGIEIFGGATTLSHIAVTDTQDDSFDFDAGWQGSANFLFVKHGTVSIDGTDVSMGNNGFETDGRKGTSTAEAPEGNPTISNVTVITTDGSSVRDDDPSQAFKFDDYINSIYMNVLMIKAESVNGTKCIEFKSDGERQADKISFAGSTMACAADFRSDVFSDNAPDALNATAKSVWFANDGSSNSIGEASDVLAANGFATNTASTKLATPVAVADGAAAAYVGAVSDQDTSSNWYKWVEAAVTAANND